MSAANSLEEAAVGNLQALLEGSYLGDPAVGATLVLCSRAAGVPAGVAVGGLDPWIGTKEILVSNDGRTLTVLADYGPTMDLGTPGPLQDFIARSIARVPARRYLLVLWDHGDGWQYFSKDDAHHSRLNLTQLQRQVSGGLAAARAAAPHSYAPRRFSLLGFDACLMSQYSVLAAMGDTADYFAGSETLEPDEGWGYAALLAGLYRAPASAAGEEAGRAVVATFMDLAAADGSNMDTMALVNARRFEAFEASFESALQALLAAMAAAQGGANALLQFVLVRDGQRDTLPGDPSLQTTDLGMLLSGAWDALAALRDDDPAGALPAVQAALASLRACVVLFEADADTDGTTGLSVYFPRSRADYLATYDSLGDAEPLSAWRRFLDRYYDASGALFAARGAQFTPRAGAPAAPYVFFPDTAPLAPVAAGPGCVVVAGGDSRCYSLSGRLIRHGAADARLFYGVPDLRLNASVPVGAPAVKRHRRAALAASLSLEDADTLLLGSTPASVVDQAFGGTAAGTWDGSVYLLNSAPVFVRLGPPLAPLTGGASGGPRAGGRTKAARAGSRRQQPSGGSLLRRKLAQSTGPADGDAMCPPPRPLDALETWLESARPECRPALAPLLQAGAASSTCAVKLGDLACQCAALATTENWYADAIAAVENAGEACPGGWPACLAAVGSQCALAGFNASSAVQPRCANLLKASRDWPMWEQPSCLARAPTAVRRSNGSAYLCLWDVADRSTCACAEAIHSSEWYQAMSAALPSGASANASNGVDSGSDLVDPDLAIPPAGCPADPFDGDPCGAAARAALRDCQCRAALTQAAPWAAGYPRGSPCAALLTDACPAPDTAEFVSACGCVTEMEDTHWFGAYIAADCYSRGRAPNPQCDLVHLSERCTAAQGTGAGVVGAAPPVPVGPTGWVRSALVRYSPSGGPLPAVDGSSGPSDLQDAWLVDWPPGSDGSDSGNAGEDSSSAAAAGASADGDDSGDVVDDSQPYPRLFAIDPDTQILSEVQRSDGGAWWPAALRFAIPPGAAPAAMGAALALPLNQEKIAAWDAGCAWADPPRPLGRPGACAVTPVELSVLLTAWQAEAIAAGDAPRMVALEAALRAGETAGRLLLAARDVLGGTALLRSWGPALFRFGDYFQGAEPGASGDGSSSGQSDAEAQDHTLEVAIPLGLLGLALLIAGVTWLVQRVRSRAAASSGGGYASLEMAGRARGGPGRGQHDDDNDDF